MKIVYYNNSTNFSYPSLSSLDTRHPSYLFAIVSFFENFILWGSDFFLPISYPRPCDPREILKLEHEALTQKSAMYGAGSKD